MSDTTIQAATPEQDLLAAAADASASGRFLWGSATASYQVEGSPHADGGGRCIWDEFSHTPGNVHNGDTGDVACDHYHRWPQDIELMKQIGIGAYRFSIRWPRVFPDGTGKINPKGIEFYDRIVDALLEAGITPFVTLYHWDLPAALQRRGGWSNRDITDWFTEYAAAVTGALGDRVTSWTTFNEPWVVAALGHLYGVMAPGVKNIYANFDAVHNQLRAHSAAARMIKSTLSDAKVGIVLSNGGTFPATDSPEDIAAAELAHQWGNFPLFLDPLVKGHYPKELEPRIQQFLPEGYENDLSDIQFTPDFVGLNYYFSNRMRHADNWVGAEPIEEPDVAKTAMDWPIRPEGIHWLLKRAHEAYDLPSIYITENGAAFDDVTDGVVVDDPDRVAYLDSHIRQGLKARDEGVPVDGYFVWSLLDNFEWAFGYDKRFGIIRVDYETQERIVKSSGHWYSHLAKAAAGS